MINWDPHVQRVATKTRHFTSDAAIGLYSILLLPGFPGFVFNIGGVKNISRFRIERENVTGELGVGDVSSVGRVSFRDINPHPFLPQPNRQLVVPSIFMHEEIAVFYGNLFTGKLPRVSRRA